MTRRKRPRDRALIRHRQGLKAARRAGTMDDFRDAQVVRRAGRIAERLVSLRLQMPKGCRVEDCGTPKRPYKVRVWLPSQMDSLVWDPAHETVLMTGGRECTLKAAGVARVLASMIADEREGAPKR